ncbi:hypothetical protein NKJ93_33055 [Mesorhizobium sp. M0028]|uniref:hypothetical protein n=1 Tax=Mesorhizobium sp. M0028 TaxID=2956849 RepID=UPI00333BB478
MSGVLAHAGKIGRRIVSASVATTSSRRRRKPQAYSGVALPTRCVPKLATIMERRAHPQAIFASSAIYAR